VSATELGQGLFPEQVKRAELRILGYADHGEVLGGRQAVAGTSLTLSDRPSDLNCHLFGKREGITAVRIP